MLSDNTSPYPVVLVRWGIWWVWNRPVLTEAEADWEMRSRGVSDLSDVSWPVFFSPGKHQERAIRKCDIEVCSRQWWNLADLLGIFQALLMIDSSWTVSQCLPLRLALSDPGRRQPALGSLWGKPPLIARELIPTCLFILQPHLQHDAVIFPLNDHFGLL